MPGSEGGPGGADARGPCQPGWGAPSVGAEQRLPQRWQGNRVGEEAALRDCSPPTAALTKHHKLTGW